MGALVRFSRADLAGRDDSAYVACGLVEVSRDNRPRGTDDDAGGLQPGLYPMRAEIALGGGVRSRRFPLYWPRCGARGSGAPGRARVLAGNTEKTDCSQNKKIMSAETATEQKMDTQGPPVETAAGYSPPAPPAGRDGVLVPLVGAAPAPGLVPLGVGGRRPPPAGGPSRRASAPAGRR